MKWPSCIFGCTSFTYGTWVSSGAPGPVWLGLPVTLLMMLIVVWYAFATGVVTYHRPPRAALDQARKGTALADPAAPRQDRAPVETGEE